MPLERATELKGEDVGSDVADLGEIVSGDGGPFRAGR
jgi:hypothetical protein